MHNLPAKTIKTKQYKQAFFEKVYIHDADGNGMNVILRNGIFWSYEMIVFLGSCIYGL